MGGAWLIAEILSWMGMTFFAQRPATITPLSLDGEGLGIVWEYAIFPSLWSLTLEAGPGYADGPDLFREMAAVLSLCLYSHYGRSDTWGRLSSLPSSLERLLHVRLLPPCLYSLAEVGQRLGRSQRMITQHLHKGRFPGVMRVGRMWLVHALALGVCRLGIRRRGRPTLQGQDPGAAGLTAAYP